MTIPKIVAKMFIDTNILLEATDKGRAHQPDCQNFLEGLITTKQTAYITGQILREYLVVATRPVEKNGLGLSPNFAIRNINRFRSFLFQLDETPKTTQRLLELIEQNDLCGKRIHDAQIIAVMLENGINTIISYNHNDFACFDEIRCQAP